LSLQPNELAANVSPKCNNIIRIIKIISVQVAGKHYSHQNLLPEEPAFQTAFPSALNREGSAKWMDCIAHPNQTQMNSTNVE
jgi:hypothetical protein